MGLSVSISKKLGAFFLDATWAIDNELAVLFGYSGSGKSLTLRAIAGLLAPDSGTIELNGQILFSGDDGRAVPAQLRSIGFVFQDLALFPHMTVEENILYGGHGVNSQDRRERCRDMVRRFRLTGLEHRRPVDISGGQRQRVALARTLIRRPAALLLDEPFSALDAPLRREMRGLLREVQQELRIPVVLVTHDLTEAVELADMLIIYANGRVEQCAPPRDVVEQPASGPVRRLISPDFVQDTGTHDDNQELSTEILPICCAGA